MFNVTLVLHKSTIVKLLKLPLIVKVNTLNNLVVVDNMVTYGLSLNQTQAKDLNSSMLSLVVQSHVNISNQQKMAYAIH